MKPRTTVLATGHPDREREIARARLAYTHARTPFARRVALQRLERLGVVTAVPPRLTNR